jgi:fatty acid desaturase
VPNYRLAECHRATSALHDVPLLSLWGGLRTLGLVLWDEERGQMVTFRTAAAT